MIRGEKVVLKGISKKDVPLIYKWVNQEDLRHLTGTLYPVSEYEHEKWIESTMLSSDRKLFAVYVEEKCIGTIGLKNLDYINSNVELFISLGEYNSDTHIPGTGADAVYTLTNYCFEQLNFHKVYLHVFESNIKAIHCYEKVGFKLEGKLTEHHFTRGIYENVLVMGKIRNA